MRTNRKDLFYVLLTIMLVFSFNLIAFNFSYAQEVPPLDGGGEEEGELFFDEEIPEPDNLEDDGSGECDPDSGSTIENLGSNKSYNFLNSLFTPAYASGPVCYRPCVSIPEQVQVGCLIGGAVLCTTTRTAYGCLRFGPCRRGTNLSCQVVPTNIQCHCDFRNPMTSQVTRLNGVSTPFGRRCSCL